MQGYAPQHPANSTPTEGVQTHQGIVHVVLELAWTPAGGHYHQTAHVPKLGVLSNLLHQRASRPVDLEEEEERNCNLINLNF